MHHTAAVCVVVCRRAEAASPIELAALVTAAAACVASCLLHIDTISAAAFGREVELCCPRASCSTHTPLRSYSRCLLLQVMAMVQAGITPPNVRTDIDDNPPDPSRPLSAPQIPPRAKVRAAAAAVAEAFVENQLQCNMCAVQDTISHMARAARALGGG